MDMIEHAVHCLAFQAEAIADVVPNDPATIESLREGAQLLHRAAGSRHTHRGASSGELTDDTYEAQRAQLDEAEALVAKGGVRVRINAGERREPDDGADRALLRGVQDFELFDRWRAVMDELQRRELIRSVNRPLIGDYAETLVARALGATRPSGPDRGTDLVTADGRTVQVKARRDPASGQATHFDISNLDKPRFDLFVGVHFAEDFGVQGAWVLGAEKVVELAGVSGRRVLIRDIERAAASGGPGVTLLEL